MRPSEVAPSGGVRDLRDEDVPDFLDRHGVALLAFLAPGDAASDSVRGLVEVVAAKLGVEAGALDVDRERLVARAMGIKSAPVLVVFRDGAAVDRLLGAPPATIIEDAVRARL